MSDLSIEAVKRDIEKQTASSVREEDKIPGVVYGHDRESLSISVAYLPFERIYQAAKGSLIDLKIAGEEPVKVVIKEVQTDPVTGKYRHVDFHQVNLMEKLTADISLKFIGESKAVKELGGVLVKSLNHLRVECLAKDIVEAIEVDISSLTTFDDVLRVQDLNIPEGLAVKQKPDDVVVLAQAPRTEEELKALEEKPETEVGDVEVAEKGKKEEEGEEGAGDAKEEPAKGEEKPVKGGKEK